MLTGLSKKNEEKKSPPGEFNQTKEFEHTNNKRAIKCIEIHPRKGEHLQSVCAFAHNFFFLTSTSCQKACTFVTAMTSGRRKKVQLCRYLVG